MEIAVNNHKMKFSSKRLQGFFFMLAAWTGGIVNESMRAKGMPDLINPDVLAQITTFGQLWFLGGLGHAVTKGVSK